MGVHKANNRQLGWWAHHAAADLGATGRPVTGIGCEEPGGRQAESWPCVRKVWASTQAWRWISAGQVAQTVVLLAGGTTPISQYVTGEFALGGAR